MGKVIRASCVAERERRRSASLVVVASKEVEVEVTVVGVRLRLLPARRPPLSPFLSLLRRRSSSTVRLYLLYLKKIKRKFS